MRCHIVRSRRTASTFSAFWIYPMISMLCDTSQFSGFSSILSAFLKDSSVHCLHSALDQAPPERFCFVMPHYKLPGDSSPGYTVPSFYTSSAKVQTVLPYKPRLQKLCYFSDNDTGTGSSKPFYLRKKRSPN